MLVRRRSRIEGLSGGNARTAAAVVVVAQELPGDEDVDKYKNQVAEFHAFLV